MKDYQSTNNQILEEMKQEMINRMVIDNMPESKLQEIRQQVEDSFCFDGIMFKPKSVIRKSFLSFSNDRH